jgi:hypothetical protein
LAATIQYVVKAFTVNTDGIVEIRRYGEPIMIIDIVTDEVTLPPDAQDGYAALLIEGLQLWRKAMTEQPEHPWLLTVEC